MNKFVYLKNSNVIYKWFLCKNLNPKKLNKFINIHDIWHCCWWIMFALHEIVFEGQKFAQYGNFMQFSSKEKTHKEGVETASEESSRWSLSPLVFYCCHFLLLLQHWRWNSELVDALQVAPWVLGVVRQDIIVYPWPASNSPFFCLPPKCWDCKIPRPSDLQLSQFVPREGNCGIEGQKTYCESRHMSEDVLRVSSCVILTGCFSPSTQSPLTTQSVQGWSSSYH